MADASSLRLDAGAPRGDLKARWEAGQISASHRVKKFNGWAVSQRTGTRHEFNAQEGVGGAGAGPP